MKKAHLKNKILTVLAFLLVAGFAVSQTRGASKDNQEYINQCANSLSGIQAGITPTAEQKRQYDELVKQLKASPYGDWSKSPSTIISLYHEKMNEKFNAYIKQMLAADSKNKAEGKPDPSKPPARKPDGIPGSCANNFSTYCVATTLYTDPKIGYEMLEKIMSCRKKELYDDSQQGKAWNDWLTIGDYASRKYQAGAAINASVKQNAIQQKLDEAQKAFDQTLSAYDQLKLAWQMHKKYMEIYWKLIKYRDLLVEIRRSVETFPAKFIDASTTKCT